MASSITGGCACGGIRYEVSAEPLVAFNCHCLDCKKATGSAYVTAIAVPAAALKIIGVEPKYHQLKGESGNTMSRGFCPECGSRLFSKNSANTEAIGIHVGSLDDPGAHRPTMDIWTASAQPWEAMNPELPKLPKGFPTSH